MIRWPRWTRGRHRPTKTDPRTLGSAAGTITAMGQAGPDLAGDGSPKRPGSRQSWRVAHKQAKGATRGYVGEAVSPDDYRPAFTYRPAHYPHPLVETWESSRQWYEKPRWWQVRHG